MREIPTPSRATSSNATPPGAGSGRRSSHRPTGRRRRCRSVSVGARKDARAADGATRRQTVCGRRARGWAWAPSGLRQRQVPVLSIVEPKTKRKRSKCKVVQVQVVQVLLNRNTYPLPTQCRARRWHRGMRIIAFGWISDATERRQNRTKSRGAGGAKLFSRHIHWGAGIIFLARTLYEYSLTPCSPRAASQCARRRRARRAPRPRSRARAAR